MVAKLSNYNVLKGVHPSFTLCTSSSWRNAPSSWWWCLTLAISSSERLGNALQVYTHNHTLRPHIQVYIHTIYHSPHYACAYPGTYTRLHTYIHIHTHSLYTHLHAHTYTSLCTHLHTHIHSLSAHTYTHTLSLSVHTYIHTLSPSAHTYIHTLTAHTYVTKTINNIILRERLTSPSLLFPSGPLASRLHSVARINASVARSELWTTMYYYSSMPFCLPRQPQLHFSTIFLPLLLKHAQSQVPAFAPTHSY